MADDLRGIHPNVGDFFKDGVWKKESKSTEYSGEFSSLTQDDFDKLVNGVSKKDEQELQKEIKAEKKYLQDKLDKANKDILLEQGGKIVLRGYHEDEIKEIELEKEVEKSNIDKVLDGLNL